MLQYPQVTEGTKPEASSDKKKTAGNQKHDGSCEDGMCSDSSIELGILVRASVFLQLLPIVSDS